MMASLSKNQKENLSKIKEGSKYKISDALALVKECATAKFDESVDVSINPVSYTHLTLPTILRV